MNNSWKRINGYKYECSFRKDFTPRGYSQITLTRQGTLESGIDVGHGVNIGPGKFAKKDKRRALNKRGASEV